jgi:hypothetical protein
VPEHPAPLPGRSWPRMPGARDGGYSQAKPAAGALCARAGANGSGTPGPRPPPTLPLRGSEGGDTPRRRGCAWPDRGPNSAASEPSQPRGTTPPSGSVAPGPGPPATLHSLPSKHAGLERSRLVTSAPCGNQGRNPGLVHRGPGAREGHGEKPGASPLLVTGCRSWVMATPGSTPGPSTHPWGVSRVGWSGLHPSQGGARGPAGAVPDP